jgi:hypothetical protein
MSGTNGVRAGTGCFAGFGGWAPDTLARFRQTRTHIYYIHGLSLSAAGHDRCRSRARLADLLGIFGRLLPGYRPAFGARLLKEEDLGFYGLRCTYLLGNKPLSILNILGGHTLALVNRTAPTQREKSHVTLPACPWYGTKTQDPCQCRVILVGCLPSFTLQSRPSQLELTGRGWQCEVVWIPLAECGKYRQAAILSHRLFYYYSSTAILCGLFVNSHSKNAAASRATR